MTEKKKQTYDFICFTDLAYEFDFSKEKEIEKKIKRRLKYHKLGDYNQERVDYIRQFKNDLYIEISQFEKSTYYHRTESYYAALADFDIEKMSTDFFKKYPKIDKEEVTGMIGFAVYLYYLR